jgi:two-component system, response regulator PdtaR
VGHPGDLLNEKVLIVEDNALLALSMREVLAQAGLQVVGVAATATEAVRLASETNPDIAILDIRLAGKRDGIEAAMLLRQRSALPVLFVTGEVDSATRLRAAAAEPAAYLLKPVSTNQLLRAVSVALQAHSTGIDGAGS